MTGIIIPYLKVYGNVRQEGTIIRERTVSGKSREFVREMVLKIETFFFPLENLVIVGRLSSLTLITTIQMRVIMSHARILTSEVSFSKVNYA